MSKEQEDLRQKFVNETKSKLWLEDFTQDAGFSDAYVDWLEKQLLLYNVVERSEQLVCDCPDEKLWEIKGKIVCECGKYHEKKAN